MARTQQKQKKETRKEQSSFVSRKPKVSVKLKKKTTELVVNKNKAEELSIKISKTRIDAKSFIDKFKADIARKRNEYLKYTQDWQKNKTP